MRELRQGTAAIVPVGPFINPATGDIVTGVDVDAADVFLYKNDGSGTGSAKNDATNNAASDARGMSPVTLNATDTGTAGPLDIVANMFADTGTPMIVRERCVVLSQEAYDLKYGTESLLTLLGIKVARSVMLSTGHTPTSGRLAAGDYAKAKAGYTLIWVPATNDLHRIKTLSADTNGDWTVATGDAFSVDPDGATYYLITVPTNLPIQAADIEDGALTASKFGATVDPTAIPGATATIPEIIAWLGALSKRKLVEDNAAHTLKLYAANGTTVIATFAITKTSTTVTRGAAA